MTDTVKHTAMYSRRWRNTRWYRIWRTLVIHRDRGSCQVCSATERLHAHHIKHASYWKELRYHVSNGTTLCQSCHSMLHNKVAGGTRIKCTEKHYNALVYIFNKYKEDSK